MDANRGGRGWVCIVLLGRKKAGAPQIQTTDATVLDPAEPHLLDDVPPLGFPFRAQPEPVAEALAPRDGRLDLERALPQSRMGSPNPAAGSASEHIWTAQELQELERQNLVRALEATNRRVSGAGGAAELLGMKPSTLSSRMKALGIERP